MKGIFDFTVDTLGQCKNPSPIKLSTVEGDFVANYVKDNEFIRYNVDVYAGEKDATEKQLSNLIEKAGPRELIYFNPAHVNAGIVTCGGLCPGINDVIRALVRCLYNRYGVKRVRGIRFGFKGLLPEEGFSPIDLTPDIVDDIHKVGGSFLGTSRGGGDRVTEIVDALESLNMNMFFVIGGDGTQRGALEIAEEIEKRKLKIAVIGIPKTLITTLSLSSALLALTPRYNKQLKLFPQPTWKRIPISTALDLSSSWDENRALSQQQPPLQAMRQTSVSYQRSPSILKENRAF